MNELTTVTYWMGRAAAGLSLLGGVGVLGALLSKGGAWRERWDRYVANLADDLGFLQSPVPATTVVLGQLGALVVGGTLAAFGQLWVGSTFVALAVVTRPWITKKRIERVARIEAQLEPWLGALGNALSASPSLGEALASTARLMSDPIRSELELVLKEHRLGTPLDVAFDAAADRIGARSVRTAFLTLRIARNTGGNLPQTLATSAQSLREMARLDGVVRTKTAEGKAQAIIIGIIPLPLYAMISWLSPGFFDPLQTSTTGTLIIAAAVVLWLSAIISAQKILAVDI